MATESAGTTPIAPARSVGRILRGIGFYAVMVGVALLIIVPVVYAVVSGFRTTGQLLERPFGLPNPWIVDNYVGVLTSDFFWPELVNSLLVAVVTAVVAVGVASLAAFVFGRMMFRGRELLYMLFVLGLLFPSAVAILPLYVLIRQLGLLDNLLGVALPQAAFQLPLTIVILRPFLRSIPAELEDAAKIDGCSTFGFFWRIALPLSRPALATVSVLAIVVSWNAFLLPLLVLSSQDNWTLPLGVMNFSTQYAADYARIFAFTILAVVPALLFYVVAERQIISGLSSGAVKG